MGLLEVRDLSICTPDRVLVSNLNLQIAPGEIQTLMGPSGSGKSTILHWMVGHIGTYFSAQGSIVINGTRREHLPIELRRIGILFQDDLLFPNMSVAQNLLFALPDYVRGTFARSQAIKRALRQVDLSGFEHRDPMTLSGGQRARVSLMRSLLAEPEALLLDEPFPKLDRTLRAQLRQLVYDQVAQYEVPTVLVTHDIHDVPKGGTVIELVKSDESVNRAMQFIFHKGNPNAG